MAPGLARHAPGRLRITSRRINMMFHLQALPQQLQGPYYTVDDMLTTRVHMTAVADPLLLRTIAVHLRAGGAAAQGMPGGVPGAADGAGGGHSAAAAHQRPLHRRPLQTRAQGRCCSCCCSQYFVEMFAGGRSTQMKATVIQYLKGCMPPLPSTTAVNMDGPEASNMSP